MATMNNSSGQWRQVGVDFDPLCTKGKRLEEDLDAEGGMRTVQVWLDRVQDKEKRPQW